VFEKNNDIMVYVSEIVAVYVSNHEMNKELLPNFIQLVHRGLKSISSDSFVNTSHRLVPAVPIEDSVKPDFIICLEDGKKFKMLKRHLKTAYNMTPNQYRQRWGLPSNYPMSSPNYSMRRQNIAKSIGLGSHSRSKKKRAA
jgi:predicted transcriptional regulator